MDVMSCSDVRGCCVNDIHPLEHALYDHLWLIDTPSVWDCVAPRECGLVEASRAEVRSPVPEAWCLPMQSKTHRQVHVVLGHITHPICRTGKGILKPCDGALQLSRRRLRSRTVVAALVPPERRKHTVIQ